MNDVKWITPQAAGLMVAAHYGRQDILNGKPQKQLLDWVTQGRVASMARELCIDAPNIPATEAREENAVLTTDEWRSVLEWNVDLSNFYRSSEVSSIGLESSTVFLKGIRVSEGDVLREMDLAGWPLHIPTERSTDSFTGDTTLSDGNNRLPSHHTFARSKMGALPPNASAANRRDEEYAHAAAELVRSGKKLSEALRSVAPVDHTRAEKSVEHAIRRTFDLMYDPRGNPL